MAKVIKERIRLQTGHTRFDVDISSPILLVYLDEWDDNVTGKTFLFNTVRNAVKSRLKGYSEFICIDHNTHTNESLLELIKSSHNKIIFIDDSCWFDLASMRDLIYDSDNQYILIKHEDGLDGKQCNYVFLEREHDGDMLILRGDIHRHNNWEQEPATETETGAIGTETGAIGTGLSV